MKQEKGIQVLMGKEAEKTAVKVSLVSILGNLVLSLGKVLVGIFAGSAALISDGVHSASDLFSSIIVIIGVKLAGKAPDRDHPYGHERFECVAAIILAAMLLLTGALMGYAAVETLQSGSYREAGIPGVAALAAAVVSIGTKEAMYWYTRHYAKALRSGALMADAWHHRSDALSSVGALIGVAGVRLGFSICEPIATLLICLMILKAAVDIFKDAILKMVDHSCDEDTEAAILAQVLGQEGVLGIDSLHTREFGSRIYVDLEIKVPGDLTLAQGHQIAQGVHDAVEGAFPAVKHIMVHVNPGEAGDGQGSAPTPGSLS